MLYHDKSSAELKRWREYCCEELKATTHPLGHKSGRVDSDTIAAEEREEIRKIDSELRRRGED